MWKRVLPLLLVSVAFAGCADGGAADPQPITAGPIAEGKGAIVGVVVDEGIRPVPGARVTLLNAEVTTETDDEGVFLFKDLDPGSYFLRAAKPGHRTTQQSIEVTTAREPPVLRVLLERVPGTEPGIEVVQWSGFIECSVRGGAPGVGNLGVNVCSVGDGVGNQDAEYVTEFQVTPDFVQAELVWHSTQALGSSLTLVVGPPDCTDVKYERSDGPSPRVVRLDRAALDARSVGPEEGLCYRVFTWTAEDTGDTAGLTLSQEFDVVFNHFQNFAPDEDWLYTRDGAHPLPQ